MKLNQSGLQRHGSARCGQTVDLLQERLALLDQALGLSLVDLLPMERGAFQQADHLGRQGITLGGDVRQLVLQVGIVAIVAGVAAGERQLPNLGGLRVVRQGQHSALPADLEAFGEELAHELEQMDAYEPV